MHFNLLIALCLVASATIIFGSPAAIKTVALPLTTSFIGDFTDPETNVHKRYYIDSTLMNWNASKSYCEGLAWEPVVIQSTAELAYLSANDKLPSLYYWTGGRQFREYRWDVGQTTAFSDDASWCTTLGDDICVALHTDSQLHDTLCATDLQPLCQIVS